MSEEFTLDVNAMAHLIQNAGGNIDRWLRGAAEQMVIDIKTSFNSGPPGMAYTHRSIQHIASQPGNPPNSDIGALLGSIRFEQDAVAEHTVYIADGVPYGIYLEMGTEHIDPRPFIGPAFAEWGDGGKLEADARTELRLLDG